MKFLSTRQTGFLHNISFLMLIIIASACLCNYSFAGQWDKQVPLATSSWVDFPSQSKANNDSIDRLLAGYREGLTLSYSSATAIAVSAGEVMVSDAAGTTRLMLRNASAATVTFSDLDVGSESPSTTYYIYAGATSTAAETITLKISASSTAPTSLTYFKRLGSFYNDASSNIEQYSMSNYAYVSPKDLLSSFKVYDSGWFSFSASASYAKTHNLGTTKLLITIYASTSSTGANYVSMPVAYNGDGSARQILSNVTTTTLTLKTYDGVWMNNYSNITSGYFRVIVMALE